MKKFLIILIGGCLLVFGCTDTNKESNGELNNREIQQELDSIEIQEQDMYLIDEFMTKLNNDSSINLLNSVEYDASNKESDYYRVEFRLYPFKNNKSIHANINDENSTIDIVNYNLKSEFADQQIRVYVESDTIENLNNLFKKIIVLFYEDINEEELNNIIKAQYNGNETILLKNNKISGYINNKEFFLDK